MNFDLIIHLQTKTEDFKIDSKTIQQEDNKKVILAHLNINSL